MRCATATVLVACAVGAVLTGCGGDAKAPAARSTVLDFPDPPAPAAVIHAQRTARRAARRYVRALRSGDVKALCRASSVRAQEAPGGVCEIAREVVRAKPLGGPRPLVREARVRGLTATVPVERGFDVTRLMLVKERGHWGVDDARGLPPLEVVVR